jgi:hypothetical protein
MRVLATVLALAYAALSALTGLFMTGVGMYERSDELLVLGLVCFAAGVFAAGALLGGSRVGDAVLGVHALLLLAGAVLSENEAGASDAVLLAYLLTVGTGLALRRVSASSRAGARDTPAGRSA